MAAHGVGTAFDWRGTSAWEKDFKKTSAGGNDTNYVDNVDAQWYTGHGWPGGFTFKNRRTTTARSSRPTPTGATATSSGCSSSPARCCATPTARTTTSAAGAGRSTACTCSTASTPTPTASAAAPAARFADYLFPDPGGTLRPALTVRNAWAPDGDRQGAVAASSTARWATSAPAASPTSATTSGARARPARTSEAASADRDVGDHRNRLGRSRRATSRPVGSARGQRRGQGDRDHRSHPGQAGREVPSRDRVLGRPQRRPER